MFGKAKGFLAALCAVALIAALSGCTLIESLTGGETTSIATPTDEAPTEAKKELSREYLLDFFIRAERAANEFYSANYEQKPDPESPQEQFRTEFGYFRVLTTYSPYFTKAFENGSQKAENVTPLQPETESSATTSPLSEVQTSPLSEAQTSALPEKVTYEWLDTRLRDSYVLKIDLGANAVSLLFTPAVGESFLLELREENGWAIQLARQSSAGWEIRQTRFNGQEGTVSRKTVSSSLPQSILDYPPSDVFSLDGDRVLKAIGGSVGIKK